MTTDIMLAAEENRGRPRRKQATHIPSLIRAAGQAGYGKVTVDADGKITLEMGPADSPDGENGERNDAD